MFNPDDYPDGPTTAEQDAALVEILARIPKLCRAQLLTVETKARANMSELPFNTYTATEQAYIQAAARIYGKDGECEIDECAAVVSEGGDDGAYVSAWVWVYNDDAGLPSNTDEEDDEEDEE